MKAFAASIALGLSLMTAGSAGAVSLTYHGAADGFRNVTFSNTPVTPAYSTVSAGGFSMSETGSLDRFVAFCVDITRALTTPAQYTKESVPSYFSSPGSPSPAARVQALFDANYLGVDTRDESAAFQMALWDVVYDTDFNHAAGAFAASSNSTVNALASTYLTAANGYTGGKVFNLTYFEAEGDPRLSQSLVTATEVPLPAGGLLLISGLGAAFLARRRKRG